MFLNFPSFNLYSTPLLILVLQGLILILLLLNRYFRKSNPSDLILALLLLLVCYEQICYTVGFMGWYDAFRNTKINYFLIPMSLGIAPLIYFYVKSLTASNFRWRKRDIWHFAPVLLLIAFRLIIFLIDGSQPGFENVQNGELKIYVDEAFVQPLHTFISFAQMLLYLAYTIQIFYYYRKKIPEFFSNTFKLELNWIRNFLIVFTVLFLYSSFQDIIGSMILNLSYSQRWWLNLFMAFIVIYVGLNGYFREPLKLKNLDFDLNPQSKDEIDINRKFDIPIKELENLKKFMVKEQPFLDPEINLSDLAGSLNVSRGHLSALINRGFEMNFNDFINSYRIKMFQKKLEEGEHEKLSLLGLAYECGFNSKATFNRVFKKLTNQSPSDYLNSI